MVFREYQELIDDVYTRFSGRYTGGTSVGGAGGGRVSGVGCDVCVPRVLFPPGEYKDMSVFEFMEVLQLSGLVPHGISEREVRCRSGGRPSCSVCVCVGG